MCKAFSLSGRVAVVTGASRGIGQAIAAGLSEAGADIAGVARSSMKETANMVKANEREFLSLETDLRAGETARQIADDAVSHYGRLDILVNCAGTTWRQPAIEFEAKYWDEVINVNLNAPFFLSQAAARRFLEQGDGGKIINIASMQSFQGGILIPAYTASKSGIAGLTRALCNEWAKHNINVNAIAPGYIETELTRPIIEDGNRSRSILENIPAGRWGRPEDIKGAAIFLASSASDYMHGHVICVDGGWLAR